MPKTAYSAYFAYQIPKTVRNSQRIDFSVSKQAPFTFTYFSYQSTIMIVGAENHLLRLLYLPISYTVVNP